MTEGKQPSKTNRVGKKRTYNNPNDKKNTKQIQEKHSEYKDEIVMLIVILISILLMLSVFQLGGKVGEFVNELLFGLFGFLAYLFPILLFLTCGFFVFNSKNKIIKRKIMCSMLLYICSISLIELFSKHKIKGILDYYTFSSMQRKGGGLLGGLISHTLSFLFGEIGALVILIILSLILFVLISGKLILSKLKEKTQERLEQRRIEQYEYFEESEEETVSACKVSEPKKRAKTFTFPKKVNEIPDKESHNKGTVETDLEEPKKDAEGKVTGMMEVTPCEEIENLTIRRAEEPYCGENAEDAPIFEKELEQKFGKGTETIADPDPLPREEEMPHSSYPYKTEEMQMIEKKEGQASTESDTEPIIPAQLPELIPYEFPPISLLFMSKKKGKGVSDRELKAVAYKLQSTLESFGVRVKISNVNCGPTVTRYEVQPDQGVKVSRITSLADDIKLNLAAADIRIEAPIPGKAAVGIEVPNKDTSMVSFRELLESEAFRKQDSNLAFAVGKDISGNTIVTDISKMPHLLIAGATGSGKSVCINTLIMSIIYKADPNDVKLIMVDPKVVELSIYNGIPHLYIPVVTDPKKASAALNWAVVEMTDRYKKFAELSVRDMKGYNSHIAKMKDNHDPQLTKMPQIVIIVDELADLMMVAPGEVEDSICRLAQMARAAGIHLILATQRPSVNVITGLIKANVPSRIAFAVSSAIDSRTILDGSGAEKLLGKGDMLFFPSGFPKPVRIQGAFISDKEVSAVVSFLREQYEKPQYDETITTKITNVQAADNIDNGTANSRDEYFEEVGKFIIEKDKASIGMLQRVFRIGFNRAARIMDQLCEAGVVGPEEGTKPRKVLMSQEEFEQYISEYL